jgi:hypothetical protein
MANDFQQAVRRGAQGSRPRRRQECRSIQVRNLNPASTRSRSRSIPSRRRRQTSGQGCRRCAEAERRQPASEQDEIEKSSAPLIEHLIELRTRLIWSIGGFFVAFLVCFFFAKQLFNLLVIPFKWAVALGWHG